MKVTADSKRVVASSALIVAPLLTWLVMGCVAAGMADAAPKKTALPVKAILADRLTGLEKEVAGLALQRPEVAGGQRPWLELRIDLRLFERWFLDQCIRAPDDSDLQSDAFIRAQHLADARALYEETMTPQGGDAATSQAAPAANPPTPAQMQAMLKLHQMTFDMADAGDVAELDKLSIAIGQSLAQISGVADGGKTLPLMRPAPLAPIVQSDAPAHPTIAQLRQTVLSNAVAVTLRRQLLSLADQADALAGDAKNRREYAELYRVLSEGVELAQGLATNTGVTPEARQQIQDQLAEGIALFADPRTRSAGQARLNGLKQYASLVGRYGKLDLRADVKTRLGPAYTYAQAHPDQAGKVLGAVDRFAALSTRYDGRKPANGSDPGRRFVEDLRRQFEDHRVQFLDSCAQLSGGGMLAATPDDLTKAVAEMKYELDLLDVLDQLPASLDTLAAYKPRPTGAIERRVAKASTTATAIVDSPERRQAFGALREIAALGAAASALERRPVANVPGDIAQAYAMNSLTAFEARWKALVSESATKLAGGGNAPGAVHRLEVARQMLDGLNSAVILEQQLQETDVLIRWADWTTPQDRLRMIFIPWRNALANAFDGFNHDRAEPGDQWVALDKASRPLFDLLAEVSRYANPCRDLPSGLAGALGRLTTPLAHQPFAVERYSGLGIELLIAAPVRDVDATTAAVLRHLAEALSSN